MQARTRKVEAESKLAGLQKDLAELGSVSGDQLGAEEAETSRLHQVLVTGIFNHCALPLCALPLSEQRVPAVNSGVRC